MRERVTNVEGLTAWGFDGVRQPITDNKRGAEAVRPSKVDATAQVTERGPPDAAEAVPEAVVAVPEDEASETAPEALMENTGAQGQLVDEQGTNPRPQDSRKREREPEENTEGGQVAEHAAKPAQEEIDVEKRTR